MNDVRSTGIILRTRPLTESSLIVHWLTSELGRVATVAKGARRPKSGFSGKLDLFYKADFTFRPSRRSDLHLLLEVGVSDFRPALRREIAYLQQASRFTQLIESATEPGAPVPEMFDLLNSALQALPEHPPQTLMLPAFEIKFLDCLGLRPDLQNAPIPSGAKETLQQLIRVPFSALASVPLRHTDAMQNYLERFLREHL